MPDQGDPIWDAEERFAEAVEPGRPSGPPIDDPDLARDLEIAGMLRTLGPGFSASADAKARVRARVMGALAVDGPPSDGGGLAASRRPQSATAAAATERLPVVPASADGGPTPLHTAPPAAGAERGEAGPTPLHAAPAAGTGPTDVGPADVAADRPTALRAVPSGEETATAVLAEPDLTRAARPRRRRRHALPSRPVTRPESPSPARRVLAVGMAAALAVLAIAGGGIFASRDALPGDPLYGIKRAAEAAGGIFAGNGSRGHHDLDLAATRLDEIERMTRDGATDPTAFTSALQDFESATGAGSRLVLSGEDPDRSAADLASWATQQAARLSASRATLPAGAQPDADDALKLLDRVHRRAVALTARAGCADVTSGAVDDLGPLPAEGPCVARQATGARAGSAPTDRARTAAPAGHDSGQVTTQGQAQTQQNGGSDPALLPGVEVGADGQSVSPTPTTSAAPSSDERKNVNVPVPVPVPITVPPLLPGKSGGLLG